MLGRSGCPQSFNHAVPERFVGQALRCRDTGGADHLVEFGAERVGPATVAAVASEQLLAGFVDTLGRFLGGYQRLTHEWDSTLARLGFEATNLVRCRYVGFDGLQDQAAPRT